MPAPTVSLPGVVDSLGSVFPLVSWPSFALRTDIDSESFSAKAVPRRFSFGAAPAASVVGGVDVQAAVPLPLSLAAEATSNVPKRQTSVTVSVLLSLQPSFVFAALILVFTLFATFVLVFCVHHFSCVYIAY